MPRMHEQELTVRAVMAMSPSELCSKTGCQNCQWCERLDCCDNQSPVALELRKLARQVECYRADMLVLAEMPDEGRKAVAALLRLGRPVDEVMGRGSR